MFDLTQLKVSEIKMIEQASGLRITEIFNDNPDIGGLAATVWVLEKRSKPTITLSEIDDRTFGDLISYLGVDEDAEDPKDD
jgi:hypothetical protein